MRKLCHCFRLIMNCSEGERRAANETAGGGSGIRTHDTVSRIHAFQACALSHSAIPPKHRARQYSRPRPCDNQWQPWQSTTMLDRRALMLAVSAALLAARRARAATVTDGAGRAVPVPARVERVFPAGPPAAILLYTLAPDCLIGWPRANSPAEREFLLADIGARPEVGRITGRGNTANLEVVL